MNTGYRVCPLCGCEEKKILHIMNNTMSESVRERTGYPSHYSIVSCYKCGMTYTDITICNTNIDFYYSNENIYNNMCVLKSHLYIKSQEMYYSCISKYLDKKSRIVDVGCGSGNFLKFLYSKNYCHVTGIDPARESIDVLVSTGINGQVGTVYTCDTLINEKEDLVISTGVLEHLLYPKDAMRHMRNMLNENGYIYVCVPAAEKYCDDLQPKANYFNHEHINHFTEYSLIMLAESVGLEIVELNVMKACDEIEYSLNAIFKKKSIDSIDDNFVVKYDKVGKESIEKYFDKIFVDERKINDILLRIKKEEKKVVIWGTGNYSGSILNGFTNIIDNILFFVDNNPNRVGTEFYGKKVFKPSVLRENQSREIKEAVLLICVMQSQRDIANDIESLGISNEFIFL